MEEQLGIADADSIAGWHISKYAILGAAAVAVIAFLIWSHVQAEKAKNAGKQYTYAMLLNNNAGGTNTTRMHWGSAAGLQGSIASAVKLGSGRVARISELETYTGAWPVEAQGASNAGWAADGAAHSLVSGSFSTVPGTEGSATELAYIWALVSAPTKQDALEIAYAAGVGVLAQVQLPSSVDTDSTLNVPISST